MSGAHHHRGGPEPDRDGIRSQRRADGATRLYLLAALVIVAAGLAYGLWQSPAARASRDDGVGADRGGAPTASARPANAASVDPTNHASAGARPAAARAVDGEDPTADLSDVLPAGSAPSMGEVIDGLHQAGIHSGLGAFPKPGTRPPLVGLAVPEDYLLPPGYARHHQSTDDGQRIEPILMFAPDAAFVDAAGRAVPLPPDRVVPPAMAPPGLPVRLVRIPPPRPGSGLP